MQVSSGRAWEWPERVAALGTAAVLAWVTLASWLYLVHAHPMADDYQVAHMGKDLGPIGYANRIWHGWSGRWTCYLLLGSALYPGDPTRTYPWILALLAAVNLAATWAFLRVVLAGTVSRNRLLVWAVAFEALLWAGLPVPHEILYWLSGAIPYRLSLSCGMLLVAALIAGSRRGGHGAARGAALLAFTVFVVGLNELIGILLTIVLAAGAWAAHRSGSAGRGWWLASCLTALSACVASRLAPGNYVRSTTFEHEGEFLFTLRSASEDALRFAREWLLDPRLLGASLFLWLSPAFRRPDPRWVRSGVRWVPLVTLTAGATLALASAGLRWATGTWLPWRMVASEYVIYLHAWFLLLFLLTRGSARLPRSEKVRSLGRAAALLALALGVLFSGNAPRAGSDIASGRLRRWSSFMEEREQELRTATERGLNRITLEPAPEFPLVLERGLDLRPEPERNQGVASYHGLRRVALRGSRVDRSAK